MSLCCYYEMKLNGTHVRFDTCRNLFKQPSKEQNYSLKIVIYRIFLDLMLHQFFFTIFFCRCRFGFCGKCNAFWSVYILTYKNSYEVTYVPQKNTTECKFIRWVFWD